jgi:hypothetical protein
MDEELQMKQLHRVFFRPWITTLAAAACLFAVPQTAESHGWWDSGSRCGPAGTSRLLASQPVESPSFPPTGATYPEGIAVLGDRVIVSGPSAFGTAGNGSPSQLTVFDRKSGALRQVVPVRGEDLSQEHYLSELFTWQDYAYSPSAQQGVLRWKFSSSNAQPVQEQYSRPFCSITGKNAPCRIPENRCPRNVRIDMPPLLNGIVVDNGDVYVTDSVHGVIWRMPAAAPWQLPVTPEVLFCSPALQGSGTEGFGLFGANGIAVIGPWIYVAVTFGPVHDATGPTSVIYRLPKYRPAPDCLEVVYTYRPVQVAPNVYVPPFVDGLRFNPRSGHLFAVLAGHNQISELDIFRREATEVARYSRPPGDTLIQGPSTIAFGPDDSAYVSNHAGGCCLDGDTNPSCYCSSAADYFGVIQLCIQ